MLTLCMTIFYRCGLKFERNKNKRRRKWKHCFTGVHSRGLKFGPIAEANHAAESTLGCDPVIIIIILILVIIIFLSLSSPWCQSFSGLRLERWSWWNWKVLHAHQELWLQVCYHLWHLQWSFNFSNGWMKNHPRQYPHYISQHQHHSASPSVSSQASWSSALATRTEGWEVMGWAGSMPWSAATTTR